MSTLTTVPTNVARRKIEVEYGIYTNTMEIRSDCLSDGDFRNIREFINFGEQLFDNETRCSSHTAQIETEGADDL